MDVATNDSSAQENTIPGIRLGLCCIFREEPIKFRTTTAKAVSSLTARKRLRKLSDLALHNAQNLQLALAACRERHIGAFRILSQIMPLRTHPDYGYAFHDLPGAKEICNILETCRDYAAEHDIRLSFHPDQFVVLNSPRPEVVESSIRELDYQAELSEIVGADVINIHPGGVYGDKPAALQRLAKSLPRLSSAVRSRLTLENDDVSYTARDTLTFCEENQVPMVYDVHHHRCLPDGLSVEEATDGAVATWNREPLFHLSSPRDGWDKPTPKYHHDYINIDDFPAYWLNKTLTIDIEAKAKELAVQRLREELGLSVSL